MRRLLVASVAALGLAGAFALPGGNANNNPVRRRKTLSFGPVHPHAVYHTEPVHTSPGFAAASRDPVEVAQRFIEELTSESAPASSFVIRKDSYTDKNSGVSHIYARQYMHGIEVADGDINVNVKDGVVISYGDSVRTLSSRPNSSSNTYAMCSSTAVLSQIPSFPVLCVGSRTRTRNIARTSSGKLRSVR